MKQQILGVLSERLCCRKGDPEISAIFYIGHASCILDVTVNVGTADEVELPVATILEQCLALEAPQVMVVHTHPSGDPRPSAQDITLTRRLCAGLRRQGRRLTDHMILTDSRYFSFRANGLL